MTWKASLRDISEAEFEAVPAPWKVIAHDHPRRFAVCPLSEHGPSVALSWRSDGIEPVVVQGAGASTWFAVDQRVACVAADGRVLLAIGLLSFVLQVRSFPNCTVVLCETEVLAFNGDYSLVSLHGLPELPVDVSERGGHLVVSCEGGQEIAVW